MPSQKSSATKIPKDGWVQELESAESAAKMSRLAGAQLRLAVAAVTHSPYTGARWHGTSFGTCALLAVYDDEGRRNPNFRIAVPAQDAVDRIVNVLFGWSISVPTVNSNSKSSLRDETLRYTSTNPTSDFGCGSGLPWNQRHGAPVPGRSDLYIESGDGRLSWRYG
jgi:hypothetical protein